MEICRYVVHVVSLISKVVNFCSINLPVQCSNIDRVRYLYLMLDMPQINLHIEDS